MNNPTDTDDLATVYPWRTDEWYEGYRSMLIGSDSDDDRDPGADPGALNATGWNSGRAQAERDILDLMRNKRG